MALGIPARSRNSGFTLVELLVTVAVLAIVLAAAVPSFRDFFDKYRLRGAVDDVVSLISNARVASVKTDTDVSIKFGGASGASWCVGANAAAVPVGGNPGGVATTCDCTIGNACQVSGERLAIDVGKHAGVVASSTSANFSFDSKLGVVVPLATTAVTFTSPSGTYDMTVNINPLGQASVCVPSGKPSIAGVSSC